MNFKRHLAWVWAAIVGGLIALNAGTVVAGEAKFEAQLVWGTNDEKPPNDDYKPVDPETLKRIESLNLKWKSFFVVKKVELETKNGASGKVPVSDKSSISVKLIEGDKVEVVFYGKKGEECSRSVQSLKTGKMLVHGGNVPENATAWLVTLKRIK